MAGPTKDKKDEASIPKRRLVINCHGGITSNPLSLNPNTALITPGALNANYVFSVSRDYNIERDFLRGKLKQVSPGNWNVYGADSKHATDVSLTPWQSRRDEDHPTYSIETVQFAKRLLESDSFWSDIDGNNRRYLDRDPDAVLVIEKNGGIEYLRGRKAIAEFFVDMRNIDSNTLGVPLMFYAPRVGKVKVLEHTSLSSVLGYLERIAPGQTTVVLAVCNAHPDPSVPNPSISYLETSAEMDVDDMVEKSLGTKAKVDSAPASPKTAAAAAAISPPVSPTVSPISVGPAASVAAAAPAAPTKTAAASVSSVSNVTIARRGGKGAFEGLAIGFGSAGEASKFLEALKGAASASKVSVEGQLQVDGNNVIIKPSIGKGTFGAYVTLPPANEHALSFGNKAFREEFVKLLNMNVSRKDNFILEPNPNTLAIGPPHGSASSALYFNSKILPITSNAPTPITMNKTIEEKKTSPVAPTLASTVTSAAAVAAAVAAAAAAAPDAVSASSATPKLSKEEAAKISATIGRFSKYAGADGSPIGNNSRQGVLAKNMISQLDPATGWENSSITQLSKPLQDQADATVTIQVKSKDEVSAFGTGVVTVSKSTLKKLSDSARIVTNSNRVTRELFLKIQKELYQYISPQDKRTLANIILYSGGANGDNVLKAWINSWKELGFPSEAEFLATLNTSMVLLATNVCHTQEAHFFIEQEKRGDVALNKLRSGNLDKQVPNIILSIPGINVRYGGLPWSVKDGVTLLGSVPVEEYITNMWKAVLEGAVLQNVRNLSMPAIGLGAFATPPQQRILAPIYFDSLFKLLASDQYKGKFDNVFFNPMDHGKAFNAELAKSQKALTDCNCNVVNFNGDVLLLAVELAKQGQRCALLNPSDADVTWGKYDIGEYYKSGDYVGEEHIGATSTAMLGSRGISDVYTNPAKIISTRRAAPTVASSKTAAAVTPPAPLSVSAAATPAASVAAPAPTPVAPAAASSVSAAAAPAAPASSTKVAAAATSVSLPTIARRGDKGSESLAIGFNSPEKAIQFAQTLRIKSLASGVSVDKHLEIEGNTVVIKPTGGKGNFGSFITGVGEPAINFNNSSLREEFIKLLNMNVNKKAFSLGKDASDFAIAPPGSGAGAIYFNPKMVSTTPTPIVTTAPAPTPAAPATSSVSTTAAPAAAPVAAATGPVAPAKTKSDQKGIWENRVAMIENMEKTWKSSREDLVFVENLSPKQKIEAISLETSMRLAQAFLDPLKEYVKKGEFDKITSELFSPKGVGSINFRVMAGYLKDNPKYLQDLPEELQELSPYKKEFMDMIMNIVQEGHTPAAPTVSAATVPAAAVAAAASGPATPVATTPTAKTALDRKGEWEKRISELEDMKRKWTSSRKDLEEFGQNLSPEQKIEKIFLEVSISSAEKLLKSMKEGVSKGEFDKIGIELNSIHSDVQVEYLLSNLDYLEDLPVGLRYDWHYKKGLVDMLQDIKEETWIAFVSTSGLGQEWQNKFGVLNSIIEKSEKSPTKASTDTMVKFSQSSEEISRNFNCKFAKELRNNIIDCLLTSNSKEGLDGLLSKESMDQMVTKVAQKVSSAGSESEPHLNPVLSDFVNKIVEEQERDIKTRASGGLGF